MSVSRGTKGDCDMGKKKYVSIMLCICLLFSIGTMSVTAEESKKGMISQESTPYAMYTLKKNDTLTYGDGYSVKILVTYTARDETANSSGLYITGVQSIDVTGYSKWDKVSSKVTINSITYSNNRQKAVISLTYQASIGAGLNSYQDSVTITV